MQKKKITVAALNMTNRIFELEENIYIMFSAMPEADSSVKLLGSLNHK